MNFNIAWRFAKNNLSKNKRIIIPFILATSIMNIMFYIMSSLISNTYVKTRHETLSLFVGIGIFVVAIFTLIFILYANRFLIKRRNKEFALYQVLGLEKKHISLIIFIEQSIQYLITIIISLIGGHIFGKLSFIITNRLLKDKTANMSDYPLSFEAIFLTLTIITFAYILIFIFNLLNIAKGSPIELLNKQKKGEGEPKGNIFIMLIGLTSLGAGYYLAFTAQGVLKSLQIFFIAILLVIIGTYLLFISLSIMILKALKKNKNHYYRAHSFLSVSGMLYRMKANAIGLASISLLATSIIISLATTLSIYLNIEKMITSSSVKDINIVVNTDYDTNTPLTEINNIKKELHNNIKSVENYKINDFEIVESIDLIPFSYIDNEITKLQLGSGSTPFFANIIYLDNYNQYAKNKLSLNDNEIYLNTNSSLFGNVEQLSFLGKTYKVKRFNRPIPSNIAVDMIVIMVKDRQMMFDLANHINTINPKDGKLNKLGYRITADYNVVNLNDDYVKAFNEIIENNGHVDDYRVEYYSRQTFAKNLYDLNGGFIFLGVIISIIFLTGAIIITYYKQISEAYEDKRNYTIMKQVGLPLELIKKTTKTQVIWMFFAPLIIATIHALAASKLILQLLLLFGILDLKYYLGNLVIIVIIFALIYTIIFELTSKTYYRIVNE